MIRMSVRDQAYIALRIVSIAGLEHAQDLDTLKTSRKFFGPKLAL